MTLRDDEPIVEFEPLGRRARVRTGATVLDASRQAGAGLTAVCGGVGTCGTCRVRIVAGDVTGPTESEAEAVAEGLRLACEARVLGDLRVDVPPESISAAQRAQVEGRERPVEVAPAVGCYPVRLDPPRLEDLRSDASRLKDALRVQHGVHVDGVENGAVRLLPTIARVHDWQVRAVTKNELVIAVLGPHDAPLGLAVDIGTTKLAGYLIDLERGETLAAAGAMNPQIAYGEDVMARISHAMGGEEPARRLHTVLVDGLDGLVGELCATAGGERQRVVEAVLVGNTCMHHLALGLPVGALGVAPYVPVLSDPVDVDASALGIRLAPGAQAHLLPNVAGFVGADHVAMVLATGIHEAAGVTVGLDIGTNTEIVLAAAGRLLSCSCASGPAFEGAHIADGMRAAPGAVERVRLADDTGGPAMVEYQTIDDAPPVGICGSGILDAVAELLRIGVLRPNGGMEPASHPRVRTTPSGDEFLLVPAGERDAPRDLVVSRRDVNEIQLAKAAIRAGIEVLLLEVGLSSSRIDRVVVAGAFGTYLDVASAVAIGMFPDLPGSRFEQVGNAAGMGAKMALLSRRHREVASLIAGAVRYVELAGDPRFVEEYTRAMMLPEPAARPR